MFLITTIKAFWYQKILFENDFSLRLGQFCLDIQMIAVKRGGKMLNINAITFRQFIEKDIKIFIPQLKIGLCISMIYSFVRIKTI